MHPKRERHSGVAEMFREISSQTKSSGINTIIQLQRSIVNAAAARTANITLSLAFLVPLQAALRVLVGDEESGAAVDAGLVLVPLLDEGAVVEDARLVMVVRFATFVEEVRPVPLALLTTLESVVLGRATP